MKLKIKFLALFLLTLLVGFSFVKQVFAADYSLSGSVKDGVGNVITNATVDVYSPGTTIDVVPPITTDSSGNYSFSSIPEGTYDIKVTPPSGSNFSSAIALRQVISANTILNFILTPAGIEIFSGKLTDALGNPLVNQTIRLVSNVDGSQTITTTNASGNYSLQVSSGTYALYIQNLSNPNTSFTQNIPEQYQVRAVNVSIAQDTVMNLILPAKRVVVHTQDASSNLVSGVVLTTTDGVDSGGLSIGGGITNASSLISNYSFSGPATDGSGNGTLWLFQTNGNSFYNITATPPSGSNYVTTSLGNVTISGDTTLTVTMQQPITVSGSLSDSLGNHLVNQTVKLVSQVDSSQTVATTDSLGNYSLRVAPGTYVLYIENLSNPNSNFSQNIPLRYRIQATNRTFTQDTTLNLTVPAKKVTMFVNDAFNNPISGVAMTTNDGLNSNGLSIGGGITNASSLFSDYSSSGPSTNSSGNATLWLLPTNGSNSYTLTATPPSGSVYGPTQLSNVTITSDTTKTITLQYPVNITGHLTDNLGNSLTNQTITLVSNVDSSQTTTTTNSSGNYSLRVSAGVYALYIKNLSNPNTSFTQNVPEQYQVRAVNQSFSQDIVLNLTIPANKVIVHVQDALNNPVSGIQVTTSDGVNNGGLTISSTIINASSLNSNYSLSGPATDSSGNAILWLLPTNGTNFYNFTATPPTGSIYGTAHLGNITVTGDQTEIVSLQYNHATPVTTVTLSPAADSQGNYSDPTTVTLSATAASGYNLQSPGGTFYTIDGGSQTTYTVPFTVTGNGSHTITYWSVDNSGVQETHHTKSFTILTTYSLSGTVFNDTNPQNGFQDPGETGVSGATVSLNTGQTATTDSNGNYSFAGLISGTYTETLTVPNGDIATTTNPATISLSSNTTQNFGVAPAGPTLVTAINAGDSSQGSYVADTDYTNGNPYTSSATVDTSGVTNPAPQAVYQSVRYGNAFSYSIPGLTPGGTYTVRLHFNELYWGTALSGNSGGLGSRVFNVAINGNQVLSNYDIYAKAGGSNIATTEQFPVTPDSNGNVTINFTTVTDNAMVNGIEVYSGTLPSPTPTPSPTPATSVIINTGGSTVGSFQADNSYSGGTTYTSSSAVDTSNITNPAPQAVYQSVRYGNTFAYNIQHLVPNTNFLVRLHFNELYWTNAGSRVFNVSINGNQVLSNFDIFQSAGGANKALVEDFIEPSDVNGKINITFTTVTDNAMVNGIEIVQPSIPQRTYYTANDGTNFTRSTSSFVSGVATQSVNSDGSITESVNSAPGYADSGFVLYEGTLGNLPNFTTLGTGSGYGLNLWFDTNNNNEYFAWDSNNILTGLNGDTYALSNGSQNGLLNVNGGTSFFLMSNGQSYSLSDLKAGLAPGINANTKVAVWIGVNTNSGSTSSTIQSVNGL